MEKATHQGKLTIGDIGIKCYVLEDGTRVLSRIEAIRAIGRTGKAKGGRQYDAEFNLPVFLTAKNLKPFIPKDLIENSAPVIFKQKNSEVIGYKAELLPQICGIFLDAEAAGVLQANQKHIAERAKILIRGFAIIGITALIDEATGYQEVRDRKALQAILDKYLNKEFAAWAKRFPDEFYKEIFRLKGWVWTGLNVKRPSVIGHYTNDLIYDRLAPGIKDELQKITPLDSKGRKKVRYHQFLTSDIGHPALAQHLHAVMGLMRASSSWDGFKRILSRSFPKYGETPDLPFDDF